MSVKKLVQSLTECFVDDEMTDGWIFKRSRSHFLRDLGNGLVIMVHPGWTFLLNGSVALSQPHVFLQSRTVQGLEKEILGKMGNGILGYSYIPDVWQPPFPKTSFVEFMSPEITKTGAYSLVYTVPSYLRDLLIDGNKFLHTRVDLSSERAFLKSLPEEFSFSSNFSGLGSRGFASFLLVRMFLGDFSALRFFEDEYGANFFPRERPIFDALVDGIDKVRQLADAGDH